MLFTFSVLPSIGSNSSNAMCAVPLKNQQNFGLSFILGFFILSSVACGGIQTHDREILRQIFYHCATVKRLHDTQNDETQHNAIPLNDIQHNNKSNSTLGIIALSIMTLSTECWCFSVYFVLSFVMLSVVRLSIVMLNIIILIVDMLSVVMLNVVSLSIIILNVVRLSIIILNIIMLSAVMLSTVMLNVVRLSIVMLGVVRLSIIMLSGVAPVKQP